MGRLLIDADDAIARLFQEGDDFAPAVGVVPVFALGGALHRDADIGLSDWPVVVAERDARRLLGRIDAQDIAGSAVQANMTEVAGLEDVVLVVEEKPHGVSCVIALGLDFIVREKRDLGIAVTQERDQLVAQSAGQPAAMALLKLHRIGKPAHRIAKRANRELDQNIAILGGIIMDKKALTILPHFKAETDKIALAAVDPSRLQYSLKQGVASIEITQAHPPWMLTFRQYHAAAVIEVETQPLWTPLGREFGRRR